MRSNSLHRILLIICLTCLISGMFNQNSVIATDDLSTHDVKILFVMDHNYGANYHFIRPILEQYGWNVTITGLFETLNPCTYHSATLDVDILIPEITNITEFDVISILPGDSHDNLRASEVALDLIRDAVDEGLVVSAWCRGVRVLATADVLDGVNITGNADYREEYEAAGATFNELVPPVIDGNIVTGVRSRFYRTEMCIAIATALGVYEAAPPEVSNTIVSPSLAEINDTITISTQATDSSGILSIDARIFRIIDGEKPSSPTRTLEMNDTNSDGIYTTVPETFDLGNYSVDLRVYDIFENRLTLENATSFTVVEEITNPTPTPTPTDGMIIYAAVAGIAIIGVVLIIIWKVKSG